ncbi:hypothetical protein FQR65_LT13013 [Abscondita terminalis]|nr:hypothetical protein FQR65_LT13013 [Abscondita terminalis]
MHSTVTVLVVNPKKALKFTKEVHNIIWKVAKETVCIFETSIMIKLGLSLLYAVFGCFWTTKGEFMGRKIPYSRYGVNAVFAATTTVDISMIIYDFASLSDKAKETVQIIHDLEKSAGASNLPYLQVELFSLQMYVDDIKFKVFGTFPLDWTILHSKTLKFIKEIHNLIWKVAKETNSVFESSIMFKLALSLLYVVFGSFWGSKGAFMGRKIPYSRYGINAVCAVITIVDISMVIHHFASFSDKVGFDYLM